MDLLAHLLLHVFGIAANSLNALQVLMSIDQFLRASDSQAHKDFNLPLLKPTIPSLGLPSFWLDDFTI